MEHFSHQQNNKTTCSCVERVVMFILHLCRIWSIFTTHCFQYGAAKHWGTTHAYIYGMC